MKKSVITRVLAASLCAMGLLANAQTTVLNEPRNIVQLSAQGTVEAPQDWLTLTLSVTREGSDASSVQAALRDTLESARKALKQEAQPGAMELRSGAFNLQPRYAKDGKINGWLGSSEWVLEGTDFARISAAAAKVPAMAISGLYFSLSRQTRAQLEAQAQTLAIEGFQMKAAQIARSFGFSDYVLREVQVSSVEQGGAMPRMMPMSSRAMVTDAPPMPMESGKSLVQVSVSGGVQLK
jgi:predicted secreted protein